VCKSYGLVCLVSMERPGGYTFPTTYSAPHHPFCGAFSSSSSFRFASWQFSRLSFTWRRPTWRGLLPFGKGALQERLAGSAEIAAPRLVRSRGAFLHAHALEEPKPVLADLAGGLVRSTLQGNSGHTEMRAALKGWGRHRSRAYPETLVPQSLTAGLTGQTEAVEFALTSRNMRERWALADALPIQQIPAADARGKPKRYQNRFHQDPLLPPRPELNTYRSSHLLLQSSQAVCSGLQVWQPSCPFRH
jgi:hypothetical protein